MTSQREPGSHMKRSVDHSRAILTDLMDPRSAQVGDWTADDLASVTKHQLRTRLVVEAEDLARAANMTEVDVLTLLRLSPLETFDDALCHGTPGDGVLRMVKQYAKRAMGEREGLPRPVAHFIYVATLLRARTEGRALGEGAESFTTLDDAAIVSEGRRCLTQHWLPDRARALLRVGLLED